MTIVSNISYIMAMKFTNSFADDELPLAQVNKLSDDVFSTQTTETESENIDGCCSVVISPHSICLSNPDLSKMIKSDINPDNMDVCGTIEDDVSLITIY